MGYILQLFGGSDISTFGTFFPVPFHFLPQIYHFIIIPSTKTLDVNTIMKIVLIDDENIHIVMNAMYWPTAHLLGMLLLI